MTNRITGWHVTAVTILLGAIAVLCATLETPQRKPTNLAAEIERQLR